MGGYLEAAAKRSTISSGKSAGVDNLATFGLAVLGRMHTN